MSSIRVTVAAPRLAPRAGSAPLRIATTFVALISVGTLLLMLPVSNRTGDFTPFLTALFTTTSAITVTGLVVENTAVYWTRVGQTFILAMIFLGGLSYMALATFLLILIGQRLSLAQRLLLREFLLINQLGGLVRISVVIILVAVAIQFAGSLVLFSRFYQTYPPAEAAWQAAFHAVSAFCNAGFNSLTEPGELMAFQRDKIILWTLSSLIFIGAISYLVIIDMIRVRRFSRFSLNTKLVLVVTAATILLGAAEFFVVEFNNLGTVGNLSVADKATIAVFQGVSNRTAGFNAVDYAQAHPGTSVATLPMMFIGGSAASVSGGIKVNTFGIIVLLVIASFKGSSTVTAFGREIPWQQVQRAVTIAIASLVLLFVMTMLLRLTETGHTFLEVMFEAMSAFGTVGISLGITSDLTTWGRVIIIILMFIGKLGPLTLGLGMAEQRGSDLLRYPREGVFLG